MAEPINLIKNLLPSTEFRRLVVEAANYGFLLKESKLDEEYILRETHRFCQLSVFQIPQFKYVSNTVALMYAAYVFSQVVLEDFQTNEITAIRTKI